MVVFFPSQFKYPPYWGTTTSTSNFCEDDYHVTSYAAEFINTISNVGYVYYGACGVLNNWSRKPFFHFNLQYLALIGVGVGSGVFHMTMKRSFQSADQISMFLGAGVVLHRIMTIDRPQWTLPLGISLFIGLLLIFQIQYKLGQPLYHWVTFAAMIFVVWRQVVCLTKVSVGTAEDKRLLRRIGNIGFWTFALGFGFWLVDVQLCLKLRELREQLGMPLELLLEFHGWWHLLTAIGAYMYMVLVEYLHLSTTSRTSKTASFSIQFFFPFQTPVVFTSDLKE